MPNLEAIQFLQAPVPVVVGVERVEDGEQREDGAGGQGTSADLEIMAEQIRKTKLMGAEILAKNCGQTVEKVMKDFDRDYWMDAKESIAYGIVDDVLSKI